MPGKSLESLEARAKAAPELPGVYFFKDAMGKTLYVGKAKSLKSRLASYFANDLLPKTRDMVQGASVLEYSIVDNEVEALILEANLIRKLRPRYNIDLKETHRYSYILVTDEDFPKIVTVRKNLKDELILSKASAAGAKGKVFGPFVEGSNRLSVISFLRKTFGIRTCNSLPKKACLKYHIGQCPAPCIGKISKKDYLQNVERAIKVLKGEVEGLQASLENEMAGASQRQEYEKALGLKKQLAALEALNVRQKMEISGQDSEDYVAVAKDGQKACAIVFKSSRGVVNERAQHCFDALEEEPVSQFLAVYYSSNRVPDRILLSKIPENADAIANYLEKEREKRPEFVVPMQGDRKKLLELAEKNAVLALTQSAEPGLLELKKVLRLKALPNVIECFDVSTLFENGTADKTGYRRFKIKFVDGQDDFSMIREIVFRRYYRIKKEGKPMPDLIVVDGGKGQLSAATAALDELGIYGRPIIGLAKEFEEIYSPAKPVGLQLDRKNPGLKLLMRIRDEAHRFAVTYHKKLRSKTR